MTDERDNLSASATRREKKLARHVQRERGYNYTGALSYVVELTRSIATKRDMSYPEALSALQADWGLK